MAEAARATNRRLRRYAGLLAGLSLLAASLLLSGAEPSGAALAGQAGPSATSSPIPPIPPNQDYGAYLLGRNTVSKAKTAIDIPTFLVRANTVNLFTGGYAITNVDTWALSPAGYAQRYGILPPLTTSVLAFGSVPATATVHLQQIFKNGLLEPLHVHSRSLNSYPYTTDPIVVTGQLAMTVTDVKIDQVPLDVGPNCHTVSPLPLRVVGIPSNPPYPPQPGKYSVFLGGPLDGTVGIPAFTGCQNGTENLDALLTGLISGPDNPLHLSQGSLQQWTPPEGCSLCTQPDPPPPGLH